MKKYFFAFFAIMICPIFLLSGCTAINTEFEKISTNVESVFDFYTSMISAQTRYKTLADGYSKTELQASEVVAYNNYFQNYKDLNEELFMTLPGLDAGIAQSTSAFYDLSKVDSTLSNYNIFKKSTGKYILKISGMGDNSFLPIVSLQNTNTVTDSADDIILSMGNALQYEISYSTLLKSWNVAVDAIFYYPSQQDVPAGVANDIKIVRDDGQQKITIVYTDNAQIYSKVIEFGLALKTVTKYTGDITEITNPVSTGSYIYELSAVDCLGDYEFKYDASSSYFYGKHTKSSGNYSFIECYSLKSNIFISRLNIVKTGELNQSIELLIGSDSSSGKFKHKSFSGNLPYMSDFSSISKDTFATITAEEAIQTNKILAYTLSNGEITCESVGY